MEEAGKDLTKDLLQMEHEIFALAGMEFNVSSPRQLGEVLFEKMKIASSPKKTKTKQYATSEEVLMNFADKHPIVNKILEYRMLKKLLSTYIEAPPPDRHTQDREDPHFIQSGSHCYRPVEFH